MARSVASRLAKANESGIVDEDATTNSTCRELARSGRRVWPNPSRLMRSVRYHASSRLSNLEGRGFVFSTRLSDLKHGAAGRIGARIVANEGNR